MGRIYRVNADDPSEWVSIRRAEGSSARGVAVDGEGKIWGINIFDGNATVITPGDEIDENSVETNVAPFFDYPYTYSDMTGTQLSIAVSSDGFYREIVHTCNVDPPFWTDLEFDAVVPDSTSVLFRVRTSAAAEMLEAAPWVTLARVPDDESPVSIAEAFEERSIDQLPYLEVEIQLSRDPDDERNFTPVVLDMNIVQECMVY